MSRGRRGSSRPSRRRTTSRSPLPTAWPAAFQRREQADQRASRAFDAAVLPHETTPGGILTNPKLDPMGFMAIDRYRATAQQHLFDTDRLREVYRQRRRVDSTPV